MWLWPVAGQRQNTFRTKRKSYRVDFSTFFKILLASLYFYIIYSSCFSPFSFPPFSLRFLLSLSFSFFSLSSSFSLLLLSLSLSRSCSISLSPSLFLILPFPFFFSFYPFSLSPLSPTIPSCNIHTHVLLS